MTVSSTTDGTPPHFHTHRQGRAWTDADDTGHRHLIVRPWTSPECCPATFPHAPDRNHDHTFGGRT